jgi:hypothetical protein
MARPGRPETLAASFVLPHRLQPPDCDWISSWSITLDGSMRETFRPREQLTDGAPTQSPAYRNLVSPRWESCLPFLDNPCSSAAKSISGSMPGQLAGAFLVRPRAAALLRSPVISSHLRLPISPSGTHPGGYILFAQPPKQRFIIRMYGCPSRNRKVYNCFGRTGMQDDDFS